jgi:hypothetical protein
MSCRRQQGRFCRIVLGLVGGSMVASAWGADTPTSDAAAPAKAAGASADSDNWLPLGLQSYEPSAFGYTKNNDDVAFYNIKISVKFPLMPGLVDKLNQWSGKQDHFNFAFTGAFGFYIGSRYSSPVVGKEYNPQLFWQRNLGCSHDHYTSTHAYGDVYSDSPCYFALGYNHDSNGQSIDSPGQYLQTQRSQGTEAANDAISRGWDYVGFTAKYIPLSSGEYRISLYPELKYFLSDGLLQGKPEELHYWEHPSDGKPRKEVDGLALLAKIQNHVGMELFHDETIVGDGKIAVRYGTGYQDAFRYGTVRIEAGIQLLQVPIVFWAQKGYMSDLSQYYRNVKGYGVQIEIGAF